MVELHLTDFVAESRGLALATIISSLGLAQAKLIRDDYYKPFLQTPEGQIFGLGITHIRKAAKPFSLMAASTYPQLGLDAELWNHAPRDDVFLKNVMAKEETELAQAVNVKGHDAGLLLWVGKEASLKSHGLAMVDPRHLALRQVSANHFRAEASMAATAPVTPANVWFYTYAAPEIGQHILVAIAVADNPQPVKSISLRAEKLQGIKPLNLDSL
ncbi:MAG: 4'-phosphopantetheinyl transferase superfamily protein [Aestuariivirga sp.]